MWVKCRFSGAGNDEASRTLGAGQNGAGKIPESRCRTMVAEPMEANACETAFTEDHVVCLGRDQAAQRRPTTVACPGYELRAVRRTGPANASLTRCFSLVISSNVDIVYPSGQSGG